MQCCHKIIHNRKYYVTKIKERLTKTPKPETTYTPAHTALYADLDDFLLHQRPSAEYRNKLTNLYSNPTYQSILAQYGIDTVGYFSLYDDRCCQSKLEALHQALFDAEKLNRAEPTDLTSPVNQYTPLLKNSPATFNQKSSTALKPATPKQMNFKTDDTETKDSPPPAKKNQIIVSQKSKLGLEQQNKSAAATKIRANFIGYTIRNTNTTTLKKNQQLIDLKAKKIIFAEMQKVCNYFKLVPTADFLNSALTTDDAYLKLNLLTHQLRHDYHQSISVKKFGNCMEQALAMYLLIKNNPKLSSELKEATNLTRLASPDDHTFVVIGDINDPESLVIDPWLKFVNFPPKPGFRQTKVLNTDKQAGFIGKKAEYFNFINNHEDGIFIEKKHVHQLKLINPSNLAMLEVTKTLEKAFIEPPKSKCTIF